MAHRVLLYLFWKVKLLSVWIMKYKRHNISLELLQANQNRYFYSINRRISSFGWIHLYSLITKKFDCFFKHWLISLFLILHISSCLFLLFIKTLILDLPHSYHDGRYLHNISNCGSQSFLMIYSCEVEFHGILERFFVDGFTMQIPWKPPLPAFKVKVVMIMLLF